MNPDGTFEETPPVNDTFTGEEGAEGFEEAAEKVAGIDPAFLFLAVVGLIVIVYYFVVLRKKEEDEDDFFSNLDGEKVRTHSTTDSSTTYILLS